MYRFYLAAIDILPAALLLAPAYLILNKAYFHNSRKSIFYFLFSCYLSVIYILVGLPNVTYIRPEPNMNLIPLVGIIDDWKNSILNVLLFVPMGMMLPILWSKFRQKKNTLLFGFGTSLTIELLQMLTFRVTDVNDLITNTLGTYLGFLFLQSVLHRSAKLKHMVNDGDSRELGILLAVVLIVMFFVYPFASSALWDLIL